MIRGWIALALALAWLTAGTGCRRSSVAGAPSSGAGALTLDEPKAALPKRPPLKLFVGKHTLQAEVLRTAEEIRTGMMFRTSLAEDEAMLFVFARPHRAAFWMKNVTVPLTAAYLDPAGRVLELHDLEPGEERSVSASTDRVQYVIETRRGWFERRGLGPGVLVQTELGPLAESFR